MDQRLENKYFCSFHVVLEAHLLQTNLRIGMLATGKTYQLSLIYYEAMEL